MMSDAFLSSIKNRRTIYTLDKQLPIFQEKVIELVKKAVSYSPSAFSSQTSRVVVLLGVEHEQSWNIAEGELKKIVPADTFATTETRLNSFVAGADTILLFKDQTIVRQLQEQFALYADNFSTWSEQASGMAQLAVWTVLAEHKVDANLQHYSPLVDAQTHKVQNLPESWGLRAQIPFGAIAASAGEKAFITKSERFKVFGNWSAEIAVEKPYLRRGTLSFPRRLSRVALPISAGARFSPAACPPR